MTTDVTPEKGAGRKRATDAIAARVPDSTKRIRGTNVSGQVSNGLDVYLD
jgi:hypothetical protein